MRYWVHLAPRPTSVAEMGAFAFYGGEVWDVIECSGFVLHPTGALETWVDVYDEIGHTRKDVNLLAPGQWLRLRQKTTEEEGSRGNNDDRH